MDDKIRTYTLSAENRENCLRRISRFLEPDQRILFAYAHGSFLAPSPFRDLDIAVFLTPDRLPLRPHVYETKLETAINEHLNASFPLDVRIMNSARIPFRYRAFQGRLLIDRNPEIRIDIMTRTASVYLDIAPILMHHTKEAFSRHAQS